MATKGTGVKKPIKFTMVNVPGAKVIQSAVQSTNMSKIVSPNTSPRTASKAMTESQSVIPPTSIKGFVGSQGNNGSSR